MHQYTSEDEICPVCKGNPDNNTLISDSVMSGKVQVQFECYSCGSTWDVIYQAFAVINLEERHEGAE